MQGLRVFRRYPTIADNLSLGPVAPIATKVYDSTSTDTASADAQYFAPTEQLGRNGLWPKSDLLAPVAERPETRLRG